MKKNKLLLIIWLTPLWAFSQTVSSQFSSQELKGNEFSISVGYMFEGEGYAAYFDQYFSVGETILIRSEFDHYFSAMGNRFGFGAYYMLGFPYYSYVYEVVTMHEFGLVLKGRLNAGEKLLIKPGIYTGYRSYSGGEYTTVGPGTGFGLNASLAFQFQTNGIKPFIDLGIMTQPAGGNDETDITYSPTFQINFGITF
ncbi:MAG: hypothetical protein WAZ98_06265 [Cyclobacteriaceae bacterium]